MLEWFSKPARMARVARRTERRATNRRIAYENAAMRCGGQIEPRVSVPPPVRK